MSPPLYTMVLTLFTHNSRLALGAAQDAMIFPPEVEEKPVFCSPAAFSRAETGSVKSAEMMIILIRFMVYSSLSVIRIQIKVQCGFDVVYYNWLGCLP